MNRGLNQHSSENGNPVEAAERCGFVAIESDAFIGCSSGLAYKHGHCYSNWFHLSDLFVEKEYRRRNLEAVSLGNLEERAKTLGVKFVFTWTAGYEAPGFYKKQGYEIFAEFEDWYFSGHSRVGLRKSVSDETVAESV